MVMTRLIPVLLIGLFLVSCAPSRMEQRHQRAMEIKTSAECVYQELFVLYQAGHLSEPRLLDARAAYDRVAQAQYGYLRALEDGVPHPDPAALDTAFAALLDLAREAGISPEALTCPSQPPS